jgi:hypothetical protein
LPTLAFVSTLVLADDWPSLFAPEVAMPEDCVVEDDEFASVEDWFAFTSLPVDWLPLELTLGFTLVEVPPDVPPELAEGSALWLDCCVLELWFEAVPWLIVEEELMSVDCWLAVTPLLTL